MHPRARLCVRCGKYIVMGALIGAFLGLITFLPGEMLAEPSTTGATGDGNILTLGVALVMARVGAVVGLIFFLIKRSLTGEMADPRVASP